MPRPRPLVLPVIVQSPGVGYEVMSTSWTLKPAAAVKTAPVVAIGLLGGYVTARETGIRPLGGVVLGVAGAYAIRSWAARRGPATAAALGAVYVLGFGLSHSLAKKIGSWPAVLTVTAASAVASHLLSDDRPERAAIEG